MNKLNYISTIVLAGLSSVSTHAGIIAYSSIESPLPPSIVSEGFQCCNTDQLGNLVQTAAAGTLSTATVVMDNWAFMSEWSGGWGPSSNPTQFTPDPSGFTVPITLTLYNVGPGNSVGTAFATLQENVLIPWRPEPDPVNCPGGGSNSDYSSGGNCYAGAASLATFDFTSLNVTLPSQFIYGIAYNTETWGANPLGYDGPFDSLNVGLNTVSPSVGSDVVPGTLYSSDNSTSHVFMAETGWSPYTPEAEFDVLSPTPEPSTFAFVGFGLIGLAVAARAKRLRAN